MESKQQHTQAHFVPVIPIIAGAAGLFGGWKLFGNKEEEETEPNPVIYYTMLFLFVAVLVSLSIFAYKKLSK